MTSSGIWLESPQTRLHGVLSDLPEWRRLDISGRECWLCADYKVLPGHRSVQHALVYDLLKLHGALLRRRDGLQWLLLWPGHREGVCSGGTVHQAPDISHHGELGARLLRLRCCPQSAGRRRGAQELWGHPALSCKWSYCTSFKGLTCNTESIICYWSVLPAYWTG